jgi:Tol biopolymer transport system component
MLETWRRFQDLVGVETLPQRAGTGILPYKPSKYLHKTKSLVHPSMILRKENLTVSKSNILSGFRPVVILALLCQPLSAQNSTERLTVTSAIKDAFFGFTPPGEKPEIFAPGIISLDSRLETYPTFSPDGKTLFFSVVNTAWTEGRILSTRFENGGWTQPATAPFSDDRYINWESFISLDGNRMFFASNRPSSTGMDIWMVERTSDSSWSTPVRLPDPVNSTAEDGSPCVTKNGTLYFKSLRSGGTGDSWLYRVIPKGGAYTQIENLGNIIKTNSGETEPYMSPDERYLIFISQTRTGGQGGWDLWICFREDGGSWTEPVNLGSDINTVDDEYGPRVTPDGKYLFFTRENRGKTMDIYWVAISAIERLKP